MDHMWSLAWGPPLRKRKYMYTNSESIPYYFKHFVYFLECYLLTNHGEGHFVHNGLEEIELESP